MAYNAPELLLVGAAQNLVLGNSKDGSVACVGRDNPDPESYDLIEEW